VILLEDKKRDDLFQVESACSDDCLDVESELETLPDGKGLLIRRDCDLILDSLGTSGKFAALEVLRHEKQARFRWVSLRFPAAAGLLIQVIFGYEDEM
jgi:hypothetical protein